MPASSAPASRLIVLFLFLRDWPTTLIVGLAVPFSLLITVAAMYSSASRSTS
jgi:multidrug efflux pump subunit AcrB